MRVHSVTFSSDQRQPVDAVAALVEVGFVFGAQQPVTRTLLDTFDGRLHQAHLQLQLRDAHGRQLIVSGDGTVAVHLVVDETPRRVADLPAGPVRSRLADIVDVRALQPVMSVSSIWTTATRTDRAGKVVASVNLHEQLRIANAERLVEVDQMHWTVDVEEMTGYGKQADRAHDALAGIGLTRFEGDSLSAVAAAVGVDLAGFRASPTVRLDRSMAAIDGFRAVLANLAETVMANWQGTVQQLDPEYLHDLRVAIRRTRAVLAQGKRVLPPTVLERAEQQFAWLGALTGPARDLDVYLIEWGGYTQFLSGEVVVALEPVRALLERRRDAAVGALIEGLGSPRAQQAMAWWRTWLAEPLGNDDGADTDEPAGPQATRSLGRVVAKRIAREHEKLIDDGRRIGGDAPAEQVHDLRKQAKKVRYLFDCFGSMVSKSHRKTFVARLKSLQDILGEHQDAEVHASELRAIAHQLSQSSVAPDTLLAIGKLDERLSQRLVTTRAEFDQRFADYDTSATQDALDEALADVRE